MATKDDDAREAWRSITRLFLSNEAHDRFHEACRVAGLPHPGSLKALLRLDSEDPPSMSDLAEVLHCDASYVTGLVDALETLGYVERQVSTGDRRVKLVCLSDQGRQARERATAALVEPPDGIARLDAAETRTLTRLLAKVVDRYPVVP